MTSFLVLQLADAAFPTGGFAHSGGLEAAVQAGGASSRDVPRIAREAAWQTGLGALPLVRAANGAPDEWPSLDARGDAFLTSHVANRASRTQGKALVDTADRIFGSDATKALRSRIGTGEVRGHLAPAFGVVTRALGVGASDAAQLFLHQAVRGLLSAAVRLGITGPHEAQRIQHDLAPDLERVLESTAALSPDDLAQPAPLLDLFGTTHDRLYARLFQS